MPIKLEPSDMDGMTAAEIAMLQGADAEALLAMTGNQTTEPAAGTPGEGEGADSEGGTTDAAGGKSSTEGAAAAGAEGATDTADDKDEDLSPEAVQAALDEAAPPAAAPAPKPYTVPDTDFEGQRKALLADKSKIEKEWSAGTLSDDERVEKLAEVDDKLFTLVREQTRAETLREANEQAAAQAQQAVEQQEISAMQAVAKAEAAAIAAGKPGIDYAKDTKAQQQFDAYFQAVNADPDSATLSPAQRVAEAHRMVQMRRGIQPTAAAPAQQAKPAAAAPAAPARRDVPVTLSGLPNAGLGGVKDDLLDQAGRLQGEELERWMAGQSPANIERLMRLADNSGLAH